jgi:hypothetical protein
MTIAEPVPIYLAVDNLEAHLVCSILNSAGLEAAAMDDVSYALTLPNLLRPRVYVNRADLERAKPIIEEYVQSRDPRRRSEPSGPPILVTCEECGKVSKFPPEQSGTVQECLHCHAYVDVGDDTPFDDWKDTRPEDDGGT